MKRLMQEQNEEAQRRTKERQEEEHLRRLEALEEECKDEKLVAQRKEYLENVRVRNFFFFKNVREFLNKIFKFLFISW